MRKIGIVTIIDYNNYGNRLQNYALQEFLKSFEYRILTLTNLPSVPSKKSSKNLLSIKELRKNIKKIKKIDKNFLLTNRKKRKKEKLDSFLKFTYDYIEEVDISGLTKKELNNFSFFISGSDQIWNPYFRLGNENDFLQFCLPEKRLSYAPSFGVSEIPSEYTENYKRWLNGFKELSVREESGQKIIFNLTQKESTVLLDPTMMLGRNEWEKVFKGSSLVPKSKYVLTYFLGEISSETKKTTDEFRKQGYEVINLAQISDKKYYSADPSEFLELINSSSLFLTDSFHGVVFSIIFEKVFIVYNRIDNGPLMNTRIDNLLKKFSLENRKSENISRDNIFKINYTHARSILDVEKIKSTDFLLKSLK